MQRQSQVKILNPEENMYLQVKCDSVVFFLPPQIKEIKWGDVGGWTGQGGSLLGTKR